MAVACNPGLQYYAPILVNFNSIGQLQQDPTELDAILAPLFMESNNFTSDEFWEYIGRTSFLLYWLLLADLGQISAVQTPTLDPTSSNIFVNETLYQNYLAYFETQAASDQLQVNLLL